MSENAHIMITIQSAWQHGRTQLALTSPSPTLDARLLLQHVLAVGHTFLIAHGDDRLTDVQWQTYQQLLAQADAAHPIPHLIGHAPFYGREFIVTPDVLIPRPETEQLVETAVAWALTQKRPLHLVDIGTGSGCIATTLARLLPQATITAIDISPDALAVARTNAEQHAPGRVHFIEGSILTPLSHPVDGIIANLPYVTDAEWTALDDGVKLHEPEVALKGGEDGLATIRQLLIQATHKLNPHGAIFLEIGWQQGSTVQTMARTHFPDATVALLVDFAGHDRIVTIIDD